MHDLIREFKYPAKCGNCTKFSFFVPKSRALVFLLAFPPLHECLTVSKISLMNMTHAEIIVWQTDLIMLTQAFVEEIQSNLVLVRKNWTL